ncbi:hypothetical protein [Streptomyces gardneri]|uniref:DUF4232 domain-containing protein n=1 Tax=Streptomyces gardneri TaxID=66892 RepID=A0A4Y3RN73_9ACTN|nr:hypothetical protein [Streptomyces gardneri]GEB58774.1 hypothetical protein SGA01_43790 [Streptomyces gardneri]GHH07388.1 hypothetical protein GCM10017674_48800 [Streptomyces gardneri]
MSHEKDEPRAEREARAAERDARDERDDLSGRRMLNIEPGSEPDAEPDAEPDPGADTDADSGLGDELALRRLLHGAVAGLEPTAGSLDHLRRAVPARRARKRQAVVGAAAAAVLIGTAVPAFVHVANSGGITAANPVNAGHGQDAQGGTGAETGVEGGKTSQSPASQVSPSQAAADGATGKPQQSGSGTSTQGPQVTQNPVPGDSPQCEPGQLGVSSTQTSGPDGSGSVYGTFRVANVSGQSCVVDGSGIVSFEARGAADPGKISVIRHTAGDGSGLPDPAQEATVLLLKPGGSYEVRFAWLPSETCPTSGGTPTTAPTPTTPTTQPTPTEPTPTVPPTTVPPTTTPPTTEPATQDPSAGTGGTDTGTGTDAEGGVAPQLLQEDGTPADGSVSVSHTAEPGGPVAVATVPNACAGTIYRTGILAGP